MSTEVKHGPAPQWDATVHGEFWCRVVGHYTSTPDLAAAGVTDCAFESLRPEKQRAELLALRTAFLEWFRATYETFGGTREGAIAQVQYIIDGWEGA